jgi:uncharacterized protein (DUF952 family)
MNTILHITQRQQWEKAQAIGFYQCESLESEGFIHCSTPQQVIRVANAFFAGQPGLVLLCIDSDRLQAELRYDEVEEGESFPHLYGSLNLDAVEMVLNFDPDANGKFELPSALAIP